MATIINVNDLPEPDESQKEYLLNKPSDLEIVDIRARLTNEDIMSDTITLEIEITELDKPL